MQSGNTQRQQFASDNYSGICPEALEAINHANAGHVQSYGEDRWTAQACDIFREIFEAPCEVFFVFNGTAGNSLTLASLCQSYHGVICHRYAHVATDECGAPEFFSHGAKLLPVDGADGKIDPRNIDAVIKRRSDIHFPKPRVVTLTQATELGTAYNREDLRKIHETAERNDLKIHMDGARFANALVHLDVAPREMTIDAGVDVLCLGGSKNGLGIGEAVIFFDIEAADEFAYRCKQGGQLAAKMRFIAAQWLGVLKNNAWLRHARHANDCAALMAQELEQIPEVHIIYPRQANSVFVQMQDEVIERMLAKGWLFYTFIGTGGARLISSWDTREETIHSFIADLKQAISESRA